MTCLKNYQEWGEKKDSQSSTLINMIIELIPHVRKRALPVGQTTEGVELLQHTNIPVYIHTRSHDRTMDHLIHTMDS